MQKLLIGAVFVIALIAIAAGLSVVTSDGDDDAGAVTRLELQAEAVNFVPVNREGDEPQGGDYLVEEFNLTDDGQTVGRDLDLCVIAPGDAPEAMCMFTITLDGRGSLAASALVSFGPDGQGGFIPQPFDAAVTGGTGEFVGAQGTIRIEFVDHANATWTIELS